MPIWAKIDVDMPTDGELLGQPVVTRYFWACLICLARKRDEHGLIRGYDAGLLAGQFNLPKKAVVDALSYLKSIGWVERKPDGSIFLPKFKKWHGEKTLAEQRENWRDRQARSRGGVTRDNDGDTPEGVHDPVTRDSPVTPASSVSGSGSGRSVDRSVSPPRAREGSTPDTPADPWPKGILEELMPHLGGKLGTEKPWCDFVVESLKYSSPRRVAAARKFLAGVANGKRPDKPIPYLLAMIRDGVSEPEPNSRRKPYQPLIGTAERFKGLDDGDPLGLNLEPKAKETPRG